MVQPVDFIKPRDRVPKGERRENDENGALICSCIFGIVGMVVGWIARMLFVDIV